MKKFILIISIFIIGTATLLAEIAPEEYLRMQQQAPEHIIINVLKVSTRRFLFSRTINLTVQAEVESVVTSATNLSPGDCITITYTHYNPKKGVAGPRPIPILKKGTTTDAFLAFDQQETSYLPAARGASFEPLLTWKITEEFL